LEHIVLIVSLVMDGSVETSNMDTVQDANQKVEGEEEPDQTKGWARAGRRAEYAHQGESRMKKR
jgi:hypothetical protein